MAPVLAGKVPVISTFPMVGMSVQNALLAGRASELLPGVADPDTAMENVLESCRFHPFMDLLSGPGVEKLRDVLVVALEAVPDEVRAVEVPTT